MPERLLHFADQICVSISFQESCSPMHVTLRSCHSRLSLMNVRCFEYSPR